MRRSCPPLRAAGLTLIELLIGLALTAMLMVAMTSMLQVSTAAGAVSAEQLDLQEQARFAVRRIAQRIEQTPEAVLPDKSDDTNSGTWLMPALYDLRAGALSETIGSVTSVLADNATSLRITTAPVAAGRSVVTVAFALKKGNAVASATVSVRVGAAL